MEEGTLIYCRVKSCERMAKVQLSCISPICKKAWNSGEAFFGQLDGGFVEDYPIGFCRSLLGDNCYVLDRLGEKFSFDLNIGFNGKVWVRAGFADTIFIMNVLKRAVETNNSQA
jgi:exosome complex component RRP40